MEESKAFADEYLLNISEQENNTKECIASVLRNNEIKNNHKSFFDFMKSMVDMLNLYLSMDVFGKSSLRVALKSDENKDNANIQNLLCFMDDDRFMAKFEKLSLPNRYKYMEEATLEAIKKELSA